MMVVRALFLVFGSGTVVVLGRLHDIPWHDHVKRTSFSKNDEPFYSLPETLLKPIQLNVPGGCRWDK